MRNAFFAAVLLALVALTTPTSASAFGRHHARFGGGFGAQNQAQAQGFFGDLARIALPVLINQFGPQLPPWLRLPGDAVGGGGRGTLNSTEVAPEIARQLTQVNDDLKKNLERSEKLLLSNTLPMPTPKPGG